jgi:hypothetical protein
MALAWKAGWVQALAGSNPASSATLTRRDIWTPVTDRAPRAAIFSVQLSVGILGRLPAGYTAGVTQAGWHASCLPWLHEREVALIRYLDDSVDWLLAWST